MVDLDADRSGAAVEPQVGYSRRFFLKLSATGALGLFVWDALGGVQQVLAAPIPGGTLAPGNVPKFVTPLVIPPPMPTVSSNTYSIAVRQFSQSILPAGLPATTVWSYGAANQLGTLNYPAFTIEAERGTPTQVTWINGLVTGAGGFLPHLLPVDPTLHWANPPGGVAGRDSRPTFSSTPESYTGPVPIVTHVHGMSDVADHSDGYAEAWYLPAATNIPAGFASVGTWYDFFRSKAGGGWAAGAATFTYPNVERPSTAWYHDHTLGMTRVNVYAGPAGFYIVRSVNPADNPTVAGGTPAVLPGPAPGLASRRSTRSRSPCRTGLSTPTAPCSIRTRGRSSTASPGRSSPTRMCHRSGTRSSSGTAWSSTARLGRSWMSSHAGTGSESSTAATRGS